jgi:A/G-specific adenine glycosylase
MLCPVRDDCSAIVAGDPELLPVKAGKSEKPLRRGAAFVAIRDDGAILLRTRPERGLLGGMSEVPTTGWTARVDGETSADSAPFPAEWRRACSISHVFTHFALELDVYRADVSGIATPDGHWWSPVSAVHDEALPTVMKKVIESAIPGATKRRH